VTNTSLLGDQILEEIYVQEDAKIFEVLDAVEENIWKGANKCKGNILRHHRSTTKKRTIFMWLLYWAKTGKKSDAKF